jgi:hypothetical protein
MGQQGPRCQARALFRQVQLGCPVSRKYALSDRQRAPTNDSIFPSGRWRRSPLGRSGCLLTSRQGIKNGRRSHLAEIPRKESSRDGDPLRARAGSSALSSRASKLDSDSAKQHREDGDSADAKTEAAEHALVCTSRRARSSEQRASRSTAPWPVSWRTSDAA